MVQKTMTKNIQVSRENLKFLSCSNPECDSTLFTQIFELGIWSALINPTGQDQLMQLPKMVCIKCGSAPILKTEEKMDA